MINQDKFFHESGLYASIIFLLCALIGISWMAAKINYVAMTVIAMSPLISYLAIKRQIMIFTDRDYETIAMSSLFLSTICLFLIFNQYARHEAYFIKLLLGGEVIKTNQLINDNNSIPHIEAKYWLIPINGAKYESLIGKVFFIIIISIPCINYYLYGKAQKNV